jgi:uncharacterized repeat protein (TIGR02543 family)
VGALPVPARAGHTFAGWFTPASGGEQVSSATLVTDDVTWHAHWAFDTYTVMFKSWNGEVIGTPQQVAHGSAATPPAAPQRVGHTFTGWDKAFANVTSELTVTAQYRINTHAVTFKGWDGRPLGVPQRVVYGKAATAPKASARTDYALTGWDRAFDSVTSDLTVTARYKANTYTVNLNANGGKVGKASASSTKRPYSSKLGKLVTPKRSGYKLLGWHTSKSGGKKVTAATKVTKAVTLYAHWKRVR